MRAVAPLVVVVLCALVGPSVVVASSAEEYGSSVVESTTRQQDTTWPTPSIANSSSSGDPNSSNATIIDEAPTAKTNESEASPDSSVETVATSAQETKTTHASATVQITSGNSTVDVTDASPPQVVVSSQKTRQVSTNKSAEPHVSTAAPVFSSVEYSNPTPEKPEQMSAEENATTNFTLRSFSRKAALIRSFKRKPTKAPAVRKSTYSPTTLLTTPSTSNIVNSSEVSLNATTSSAAIQTNISNLEEVGINVIPVQEADEVRNETSPSNNSTAALSVQASYLDAAIAQAISPNLTTLSPNKPFQEETPADSSVQFENATSMTEYSSNKTGSEPVSVVLRQRASSTEPSHAGLTATPAPPAVTSVVAFTSVPVVNASSLETSSGNSSAPKMATSFIVSVTYTDEQNETFVTTKDNVTVPVTLVNPTRPVTPGPPSSSSPSRRYSPPTRRTTPKPSTPPGGLVARHNLAHGKHGLNLPTRRTTPGLPGAPTRKPAVHVGRGTRAPFGIIGSTRRTTLGTKPTIRALTKIFDRARTRPHTKATSPRPLRGPRIRISTGKPVRKGFPIGPKPSLHNGTNFDLDAYTRLLNVTRRPRTKPTTWRTTFFNVTEPTVSNEVEQPVVKVAGIVKIVDGWDWSPLLGDHNTHEYRYLAYTMRKLLESVFRETSLGNWLYRVDIDGFSPGSIIVDYFVLFHQRREPVVSTSLIEAFNSHLGVNGSLGEFTLDPTYTQFEVVGVVRPKPLASSSAEPPIPQWAIAVIVIATASLIFIVLFGAVTIYGRSAQRRKYNNRLQEDDLEKAGTPTKDWESKLAASYENFAADSVYDTDDAHQEVVDDRYKAW